MPTEANNPKYYRFLSWIEKTGNTLPHPTLLFIWLCLGVLIISCLAALFNLSAIHPSSGESIKAVNLLSRYGAELILTKSVSNFTQFAPVGTVLIVVLGIGMAEHAGLISAALKAGVSKTPKGALSFVVVLLGVLSSLAADAGYVVLIPLAALVFQSAGRHPLIGIAAAFAGVSGGFSANLLIGPLDVLLAGISTEAAHLVDPSYQVNAAGNYYFIVASTLLVTVIGTLVTEKLIAPYFASKHHMNQDINHSAQQSDNFQLTGAEKKGLKVTGLFSIIFILVISFGIHSDSSFLRGNQAFLASPFMKGIVTVIAVYFGLAGWVFGKASGHYASSKEAVLGMEKSMKTMAGYLVLMFFAAQFIEYFKWSHLGSIIAISGAEALQVLNPSSTVLLICFVFFTAGINLFIGSASAKWALIAPIFVPMFMLVGIAPEATQAAFRVGDSCTNIITPLMPYFGVVVAYAQQYQKDVGLGSIMAAMVPYSLAFLFGWSILLLCWGFFNWPLGPGAPIQLL